MINWQNALIKAAIAGAIWGITYLYIRRYFNPKTKDKLQEFQADAFYGGVASAVAFILKTVVDDNLNLKVTF